MVMTSDVQTACFEDYGIALCQFRCPADHDRWHRENHIVDGHNVAFPEVPVEIRHAGEPSTLADPNLAVFYNFGDPYQRRISHPNGDSANIFLFSAEHLLPAVAPYDPAATPDRPLRLRFGPVDARTYLKQRLLLARVARQPAPEPGWVVEQAVEILDEVLATAYGAPAAHRTRPRTGRDRIHAIRRLLAAHCDQALSLRDIAATVDLSVYHLCRLFKRHTGQSVHAYRQKLRLREGLLEIEKTTTPLADLALELGFSHQSHFTEAFRRAYGVTPARLRQTLQTPDPTIKNPAGRPTR